MRFGIIYLLSLAASLQVVGNASKARAVTLTELPKQVSPKPAASQGASELLKLGSRGTAVRSLQLWLKQAGFYKGPIDGIFSSATEAAVRQFQAAKKLPVDGMAGPQTQAAILRAARSSPSSTPQPEAARLQLGAKGSRVEALQRQLNQLGYYQGRISGEFNSETKLALIKFQKAQKLGADGVAGPSTLSALEAAIRRQSVQALQRRLQARGFYSGPINGVMNAQTQAAIAAAQKAYGISANDIINGQ